MTPQQMIAIGIRFSSLWMAINSIKFLLSIPVALVSNNFPEGVSLSYTVGIVYLVVAVLLWFFPMWLAHKIAPRTRFENHINLQGLEVARVGCALIGLWFFFVAMPNMVWFLFKAFLAAGSEPAFQSLSSDAKLDVAVSFVEIVFALILIFRSGDFARFVYRKS
ncbi:MAG: hypothetical protein WAW02_01250 [Sideroxyarcus sp.]